MRNARVVFTAKRVARRGTTRFSQSPAGRCIITPPRHRNCQGLCGSQHPEGIEPRSAAFILCSEPPGMSLRAAVSAWSSWPMPPRSPEHRCYWEGEGAKRFVKARRRASLSPTGRRHFTSDTGRNVGAKVESTATAAQTASRCFHSHSMDSLRPGSVATDSRR